MKIVEKRCGFDVTDNRVLLWQSEMKMLQWLEKVCSKYSITYFLIGGSEIGAVRHKGFIPWDDDIDIGMLRKDFEVLLRVWKDELPEDYEFQYRFIEKNEAWCNLCRLRDRNTTGIIDNQIGKDIVHGAFIEIYAYDNLPDDRGKQLKMAKEMNCLIQILQNRLGQKKLRGWKMKMLALFYRSKSVEEIDRIIDKCCKTYAEQTTRNVGTLMCPQYVLSGAEVLLREDVEETILVPFETVSARIPKGFHRCLTKQYGDYMELPPIEQRGTHHSTKVFYDPTVSYQNYKEKNMKDLFEKYGYLL